MIRPCDNETQRRAYLRAMGYPLWQTHEPRVAALPLLATRGSAAGWLWLAETAGTFEQSRFQDILEACRRPSDDQRAWLATDGLQGEELSADEFHSLVAAGTRCVVFGTALAQTLALPSDPDDTRHIIVTRSLADLGQDPVAKRELWRGLQEWLA